MQSLNTWKHNRCVSWRLKDTPANPVCSWRKRKRRYAAPLIKGFLGFNTPALRLSLQSTEFGITVMDDDRLGIIPEATFEAGSLLWQLPAHAVVLRAKRWFLDWSNHLGALAVLRLRYKGKSFRWHKRLGSLMLRFGHSHLVFVKPKPNVSWKKQGRMRLIFFGSNPWYLRRLLQTIIKWRPMNIYHGRGLRLATQKVARKSGKVSAYR